MSETTTLNQEELTLPVKLAVWAMRLWPRLVSSDDTRHAAFFEAAHLEKMTQEQIHAAMHEAAHNRRAAEKKSLLRALFFGLDRCLLQRQGSARFRLCAIGGTALAWEAMYGTKKISGFDISPHFIEGAKRYAK